MIIYNTALNKARSAAFLALVDVINVGKKKADFSELDFRDLWLKKIQEHDGVLSSGWYTPPPYGMAVLTGMPIYPARISFDSLRNKTNWPGNTHINWDENLLYCYCSPVNFEYGEPGDLAITLYFGQNEQIRNHFIKTYKATQEVINILPLVKDSNELFIASQKIFNSYRVRNCVVSKTDTLPLDLGHTYPKVLRELFETPLTEENCLAISKARQFINPTSAWNFEENLQFTIEPQLVSLDDPTLPQISYHYLISKKQDDFFICNDVDTLLAEYRLI